jgi:crotonobetainyl-CoA:carnitine CoA-transferase CaiB-like acyl-CoA transferase
MTAERDGATDGARPLDGVQVLELGHIVAGPFCTLVLSDLGADVTKVEHPKGGDSVRGGSESGRSVFTVMNRDKRSVTLDIGDEDGRAAFERLVEDADVLVENFREGALERLGAAPTDLREQNPQLVVCSIKGFGDGPYRGRPALDPVAEAMSGLMSVTGRSGMPPVRAGTSVADMVASLFGAISVIGGLRDRQRTGTGQHIRVPLFESTVTLMGYWLTMTDAFGEVPGPQGASHPNWAPYDVYETADEQWVFVGPSSEEHWRALCKCLDAPELAADAKFETVVDRRAHSDELDTRLSEHVGEIQRDDLLEALHEAGVPAAPVNDTESVLDDEHLTQTEFFSKVQWPEDDDAGDVGKSVRVPRLPFDSTAFGHQSAESPPALGEDTVAVLEGVGYSEGEIEALARRDII